jgi:hypothetical protein
MALHVTSTWLRSTQAGGNSPETEPNRGTNRQNRRYKTEFNLILIGNSMPSFLSLVLTLPGGKTSPINSVA